MNCVPWGNRNIKSIYKIEIGFHHGLTEHKHWEFGWASKERSHTEKLYLSHLALHCASGVTWSCLMLKCRCHPTPPIPFVSNGSHPSSFKVRVPDPWNGISDLNTRYVLSRHYDEAMFLLLPRCSGKRTSVTKRVVTSKNGNCGWRILRVPFWTLDWPFSRYSLMQTKLNWLKIHLKTTTRVMPINGGSTELCNYPLLFWEKGFPRGRVRTFEEATKIRRNSGEP